ncbi:hypothetical protein JB92DRAFT_3131862 [Gautieria morchelliformis]|nr:hypothetical protein JB92DRAFT_3131862 [Gautieria morchelliformis]
MSPDVDVDKDTAIWRAPTVERLMTQLRADIIIVHSSLKYSDLSVSPMDTLFAKLSDNGDITPSKALKDPLLKLSYPLLYPEFHVGCGPTIDPNKHMRTYRRRLSNMSGWDLPAHGQDNDDE